MFSQNEARCDLAGSHHYAQPFVMQGGFVTHYMAYLSRLMIGHPFLVIGLFTITIEYLVLIDLYDYSLILLSWDQDDGDFCYFIQFFSRVRYVFPDAERLSTSL